LRYYDFLRGGDPPGRASKSFVQGKRGEKNVAVFDQKKFKDGAVDAARKKRLPRKDYALVFHGRGGGSLNERGHHRLSGRKRMTLLQGNDPPC